MSVKTRRPRTKKRRSQRSDGSACVALLTVENSFFKELTIQAISHYHYDSSFLVYILKFASLVVLLRV